MLPTECLILFTWYSVPPLPWMNFVQHLYLHSLRGPSPLPQTSSLPIIKSFFFQVPDQPAKPLAIIYKLMKTFLSVILHYRHSGQPYVLLKVFFTGRNFLKHCHSQCTPERSCSTIATHFWVIPAYENYSYLWDLLEFNLL